MWEGSSDRWRETSRRRGCVKNEDVAGRKLSARSISCNATSMTRLSLQTVSKEVCCFYVKWAQRARCEVAIADGLGVSGRMGLAPRKLGSGAGCRRVRRRVKCEQASLVRFKWVRMASEPGSALLLLSGMREFGARSCELFLGRWDRWAQRA